MGVSENAEGPLQRAFLTMGAGGFGDAFGPTNDPTAEPNDTADDYPRAVPALPKPRDNARSPTRAGCQPRRIMRATAAMNSSVFSAWRLMRAPCCG
jgi:hypothetical protein